MTRSEKRKRSSRIYWICLSLYGILITAAAVYALSQVWVYAEEYEASRPNNTMDAYVAELSENLWGDGIAETISSTGSDPPSPSSVMNCKIIATKPKAIGSSLIS